MVAIPARNSSRMKYAHEFSQPLRIRKPNITSAFSKGRSNDESVCERVKLTDIFGCHAGAYHDRRARGAFNFAKFGRRWCFAGARPGNNDAIHQKKLRLPHFIHDVEVRGSSVRAMFLFDVGKNPDVLAQKLFATPQQFAGAAVDPPSAA